MSVVPTAHLGNAVLQRGFVYHCIPADASARRVISEDPGAEPAEFYGYHGVDVPPCGADYLCDNGDGYLVISTESDVDAVGDVAPGWTLTPATDLSAGWIRLDEHGWALVLVKQHLGHLFTVAGTL